MQTNSLNDRVLSIYPTSWKSLRGRRGRLAHLPDLPLDILLEIFGHLRPLDLLHLARSYKQMRSFLMTRNMSWVWKQARSNVEGLPDCPPNMSEPAYANLIFSPHCHHCGSEPVMKIIWSTRDRACKTCFHEHYEQKSRLPCSSTLWTLPPDARKFAQVTGTILHNPAFHPLTSRDMRRQIYNMDIVRKLNDEYVKIKDKQQLVEEWLRKTREDHEAWAECIHALIEWHENRSLKRKGELDTARKRRFDTIVQKLTDGGWSDELEKMDLDILRTHPVVKTPKDVTERVWNGIGPKIITFMEEIKRLRLEKARIELITNRRMVFARYMAICDVHYPITTPIAELSRMEPFRAIIEGTPPDQTIAISTFPPPRETYRIFCLWRNERKQDLVGIMRDSPLVPWQVNVIHLDLATTFFRCQGPAAWEPIGQWQNIIAHPGTFSLRPHVKHPPDLARLFDDFQQEFWNVGNRVSFHGPAYLGARSIVVACGLDPGTTTAAFMDRCKPIFECASCGQNMRSRLVMTWRRGVVHAIEHANLRKPAPQWVLVARSDACYARAVAQITAQRAFYRCHICDTFGDAQSINAHIRSSHIVRQRVIITRQPPSAVTLRSPANKGRYDLFCQYCNSFRQNLGPSCWTCGMCS